MSKSGGYGTNSNINDIKFKTFRHIAELLYPPMPTLNIISQVRGI